MRSVMLMLFCVVMVAGAAGADFVLENPGFESHLAGWTATGNGTIWRNAFNNPSHFFGYNGSYGDTTVSQILGDGIDRSTGEFTLGASINTYDNKVKLGLRWWVTPDMSDTPGVMWLDWDYGNHTGNWKQYLGGPTVGDLGAKPYWIEVSARLSQLNVQGDCHNFIDCISFSTPIAPPNPPVPEPTAVTALGLGLFSVLGIVRRRR